MLIRNFQDENISGSHLVLMSFGVWSLLWWKAPGCNCAYLCTKYWFCCPLLGRKVWEKETHDVILPDKHQQHNTLSTVHFRRAMGRRKLFEKVGGKNEIGFRFTTVVMLVYGCFSCVHSILVCWPYVRLDNRFLLLVYISAPVPAMVPVLEARLWCEAASPPLFAMSCLAVTRVSCCSLLLTGCSCSSPSHSRPLSDDNTWRMSSAIPVSSSRGHPQKENLPLTPGAAPLPSSLGDDGFHRGDHNSQLSWQPVPLESTWKMPFIFQQ